MLRPLVCACALLAGLAAPAHAAQLNASALTGPETVSLMAMRNVAMLSTPADDAAPARYMRMRLDNGFLEADIADFAPQPAQEKRRSGDARAEFGSIGVSGMTPFFSVPLQGIDTADSAPFGSGNAGAGMPLMVLVWLFGVGLIGMGTVGRRKQPKP